MFWSLFDVIVLVSVARVQGTDIINTLAHKFKDLNLRSTIFQRYS